MSRPLKRRLSEAEAKAVEATEGLCDRSRRRALHQVRQVTYTYVKKSNYDIMAETGHTPDQMVGEFVMSLIMRTMFAASPLLRKADMRKSSWSINGDRLEQSKLFARSERLPTATIHHMATALSVMHCHSPQSEDDHSHVSLQTCWSRSDFANQIRVSSFFQEFSFFLHFESRSSQINKVVVMNATDFGIYCWQCQIVPVSPRFGQGQGKTWHALLRKYSAHGEKDKFVTLIASIHQWRVLSVPEARVVASVLGLPAPWNRVQELINFFRHKPCEKKNFKGGRFYRKNHIESLMANRLFDDARIEELALLEDGPFAKQFLTLTGLSRLELVEKSQSLMKKVCPCHVQVVLQDGKMQVRALKIKANDIHDRLVQFWACAHLRIVGIAHAVSRRAANPVPYHLWPTTDILDVVLKGWGRKVDTPCDTPDESDEDDD